MLLSSSATGPAPPPSTAWAEEAAAQEALTPPVDGAAQRSMAAGAGLGRVSGTHLHDLPEAILANVFAMVGDTRSRNAMALVCRRWRSLERSTRASLTLRGNVRDLFLVPACFRSVTHLDLSLLSPWGSSFLRPPPHHGVGDVMAVAAQHVEEGEEHDGPNQVIARWLRLAFPAVTSLSVYARTPSVVRALAPLWPGLRRVKMIRWHQRPYSPLGSDLAPLLCSCPSLTSLDLSHFYCWTDDLAPALQAGPQAAASLTRFDLLGLSSGQGFKSRELLAISRACPNLRHLRVSCVFDHRSVDCVGDDALLGLADNCPRLSLLHLVDASVLSAGRADREEGGAFAAEVARVSHGALEALFAGLPLLEDLALDVRHNVMDTGPVLESLSSKCPRVESLRLGHFQGICRAAGLHLDGVAVCGRLKALSISNSDLTDASLVSIARGCSRLSRFELQECPMVTEVGLRRLASLRRRTLVDVRISRCKRFNAVRSLWAVEPIRDRVERLHIDCVWGAPGSEDLPASLQEEEDEFDQLQQEPSGETSSGNAPIGAKKKRCMTAAGFGNGYSNSSDLDDWSGLWCRTWKSLHHLSLWAPVGVQLTPLPDAGLEICPNLEEISIKVEGDCRNCATPSHRLFGLSTLARYTHLWKMKLDCGGAIGYALTAPAGQMDLSLWERFYLCGIGDLNLYELDYWPPHDEDVNRRSLSPPAAGLLAECGALRKLFIHGTTHEHFMRFLLEIRNLRDAQLREDYYPAPESDTSTEMRVESCRRFEAALNRRQVAD